MIRRRAFQTPCTVEIEHSNDHFHAHVALDGDIAIHPGDRVRVHGAAIRVPFGGRLTERRIATVTRAGPIGRWWMRLKGRFALTELYEFSFSPGSLS